MNELMSLRWRRGGKPSPTLKPIDVTRRPAVEAAAEEEEEVLSPAARMFHEPNFNVYIIAIMGCKTKIDPLLVISKLPHTLLKHPRFSSLQVVIDDGNKTKEKQMKWVPTTVNLKNHVIIPYIDQSTLPVGDSSSFAAGQKFVEDYISNLTKTTIDGSKQPLWDLHILNIKTASDSESLGVFRIHHSLGDGTSLMSLLLACTRQMSDPEALPTIPTRKPKKEDDVEWGVGRVTWRMMVKVWMMVVLMWNTALDVLAFFLTAMGLTDTETALKGPEGVEHLPRRFVWRTVSLDDFKFVKNAMNTTINDVALGATQAGLSRYLNRKYGPGGSDDDTEANNSLSRQKIRVRSTLLVNIRPGAGIQALSDMMEKDTQVKWGNWIGFILLPFTIGIRDDPLEYVREAKAVVDRKKRSLESLFTFSIAELVLKLFGIKRSNDLSHRIITKTTLCFTNLVGPLEEIGFYGHHLSFIAPSSFNQPHALMINFQSCVNKMTIVLSVEESTIPDPHQLCDDILHSLQLIKNAVVSSGLSQS
ncbi:Wax ester synthase/diacylglycerol acyltransferase 11 [Linum perenne]